MALIKCPECNTEVSDKATACPKCGYPFQKVLQQEIMARSAYFSFGYVVGHIFNTGCYIYDENGNELASCEQGQSTSFRCDKPMTVQIKMSGYFGKPTIEVIPGGIYEVGITNLGAIRVQQTGRYQSSANIGFSSSISDITKTDDTWICKKCGSRNKRNAVFCRDCGEYK